MGLLVFVAVLSVLLGTRDVGPGTIWAALTAFDPADAAHEVIRNMRVPRTLLGVLAGIALALSGAMLQGLARNPLADPGILGINAGAAAAIVVAIMLLGVRELSGYVWFGLAGAAASTVVVYALASLGRDGATPVKLALAGVAVAALLDSIISAVVLIDASALNALRFWQVGSLAGRYWPIVAQSLGFVLLGAVIALGSGRALNGLALGDDMAAALGQRVRLTRFVQFTGIAVLCGAATAAVGPITFVGLTIPHLARFLVGPDYRWVLPFSLVLGPILVLAADIVGRLVVAPGELQVGVVLGVLGTPVFVLLIRYRRLVQL